MARYEQSVSESESGLQDLSDELGLSPSREMQCLRIVGSDYEKITHINWNDILSNPYNFCNGHEPVLMQRCSYLKLKNLANSSV